MRVKKLNINSNYQLGKMGFANFHYTGSITGMKQMYYGKNALLVRQGSYIYNVTLQPDIYHNIAE